MARRRKPVLATWEAEPYGCLVTVAIGATDRQLYDYLEAEGSALDDDDREQLQLGEKAAITYPLEEWRVVLRFGERVPPLREMTHEGLHATAMVLHRAGVPFSDDSEEAWAYLLDSIVDRVSLLVDGAK